jgi:hypothetical protein
VWLRRWRPRLNKWRRSWLRLGAAARARELSAIRDILYEDKWFRIATAVYAHLKKLFAEDGKAAEVIEAAYISPPTLRVCQSTCTTFVA